MPSVDDVKTIYNSRIAIKKTELTEIKEIKKRTSKIILGDL